MNVTGDKSHRKDQSTRSLYYDIINSQYVTYIGKLSRWASDHLQCSEEWKGKVKPKHLTGSK